MRRFLLPILTISSMQAAEVAVLHNGFRLRAERHEAAGNRVRLYSADGGFSEIDAGMVAGFEAEEVLPPPRPAAVPTAAPAKPASLREMIDTVAKKYDLPAEFVHSVVATESAYQTNAVSPKGAIGLMQLMPATARSYGADPRDPAQNLEAGARHLRDLLVEYDGDSARALAAYNAGAGAVSRYNGVPPYAETQNYVYRVIKRYKAATQKQPQPTQVPAAAGMN